MKYILILLLLISGAASAQFLPTSAKTKFVNGLSIGSKDSTYFTNAGDTVVLYIGRDSAVYTRYKGFHRKLAFDGSLGAYKLIADTFFTGGYTTRIRTKLIADSLGSVISTADALKKNIADTFFTTGYTTRSRTKQQIDSVLAVRVSGNSVQGRVAYWGGTNQITGSANLRWDTALNRMGIRNSAAPLAPLHVGNRNENSSVDPVILVSREIDNTTAGNGHGFSDASRLLRSGGVAYNSFDGRINIAGPNNYDHYVAFQHAPYNTSTGTIQYVSGLATVTNTDAGTIVRNSGVYVLNPIGSGTITNNYGMLIDPLTKGINNFGIHSSVAAGNRRWNFYAAGTARNLFTGITHIGDTTTYDGSPNLSVTGKAWISDSLRAGVTTTSSLTSTGVQRFNRGTLTVTFNTSYNNANVYSQIQASSSLAIATGGDNNRIFIDGTSGSIGIGQTTTVGNVLRATKTITGASSSNGILLDGAVQSDVVSQASYFRTNISTQATAFTAASISHFRASQSTIGAGSTVKEQNGFNVDATLIGATNNYAFRGQLASGSGRFNLRMDGTADNYLEGNTLIGTLSNPDNFKLIVSGGIFGNFVSGSNYRLNGVPGGWDRRYAFFGSGGTGRGGFGALGATDAITKYYIGQSNTDNVAEFDATTKQTTLYGRLAGTSDAIFTGGGVTAQRGRFTSLVLNKDSVPITTTNTQVLTIDTASGRVQRNTITSGIYTPTITSVANLSSTTAQVCYYTRIGDIVTVSGFVQTQTVSDELTTTLDISLPISSNFTSAIQLSGSAMYYTSSLGTQSGIAKADTTNDRATITWLPLNGAGEGDVLLQFTFTYRVL